MDPTATVNKILESLGSGDHKEAEQSAQDLLNWVDKGGSLPHYSSLTREYLDSVTAVFCFGVIAGVKTCNRKLFANTVA